MVGHRAVCVLPVHEWRTRCGIVVVRLTAKLVGCSRQKLPAAVSKKVLMCIARPSALVGWWSGTLGSVGGWNTTCGSNNLTRTVVEGCTCRDVCFLVFTPVCWFEVWSKCLCLLSACSESRGLRKSQWTACAGRRRVTPGTAVED